MKSFVDRDGWLVDVISVAVHVIVGAKYTDQS